MVEQKKQKKKEVQPDNAVVTYHPDGNLMDRFIHLVHMSRKAGKLQFGLENLERAIAHHKCKLIIVAEDLARNSYEKMERLVMDQSVKIIRIGTKEKYGNEFGALEIGIMCITDVNFKAGIMKMLADQ